MAFFSRNGQTKVNINMKILSFITQFKIDFYYCLLVVEKCLEKSCMGRDTWEISKKLQFLSVKKFSFHWRGKRVLRLFLKGAITPLSAMEVISAHLKFSRVFNMAFSRQLFFIFLCLPQLDRMTWYTMQLFVGFQ